MAVFLLQLSTDSHNEWDYQKDESSPLILTPSHSSPSVPPSVHQAAVLDRPLNAPLVEGPFHNVNNFTNIYTVYIYNDNPLY